MKILKSAAFDKLHDKLPKRKPIREEVVPQTKRFRCLNCGERFLEEILSEEEKQEARRQRRKTYAIACPRCGRTAIRDGWE